MRSGRATHLKRIFSKTFIFLLPMYFFYLNLFCGTSILIRYLSILQLSSKLDCICWTGKSVTNAFPRLTDIIQVFNELLTDKRHIKVSQSRLLCSTHFDSKNKRAFEKNLFKCVTRPDLSVVPLMLWIQEINKEAPA